jgi:hypothetical protein
MPIATLSKLVKSLETHLEDTFAAPHYAPGGRTPEGEEYYEKALGC